MAKMIARVVVMAGFLLGISTCVLGDPLLTFTVGQGSPVARYHLYFLDVGVGGEPVEITPPGADASSPAWSPDGSRLAFTSLKDGDPAFSHDLHIMRPDGSDMTRITNTPDLLEGSPAWSPDGRQIAFLVKDLSNKNWSVWALGLDSGVKRELVPHGGEFEIVPTYLAWSPDGQRVAFSAAAGGVRNVYAVHVDTKQVDLLYKSSFLASVQDWLPTGEILMVNFGGEGSWLGLLSPNGDFEVLFPEVQEKLWVFNARATWRWPDLIVFNASPRSDNVSAIDVHIYRVKRDGTGLRQLTFGEWGGLVPDLWYDALGVPTPADRLTTTWGGLKADLVR